MNKKRAYLGKIKERNEGIFLYDFAWECDWYWGGGYIGNRNMHAHFNGAFLKTPDIRGHCLGNFITPWTNQPEYLQGTGTELSNGCSIWEPLSTFLDCPQYDESQWWRIKDLFKQFYALKEAAEVFKHGGHCSTDERVAGEINDNMAFRLNHQIETVIIPAIRNLVSFE